MPQDSSGDTLKAGRREIHLNHTTGMLKCASNPVSRING